MSYPPNPTPGGAAAPGGAALPGTAALPGGPTHPRRPVGPVLWASGILIVMALAGLVYGIAALVEMGTVVDRFRSGAASTGAAESSVDALVGLIRVGAIVAAVLGVLAALLLGSLAAGNLRGANGARIATWAVCALGVLCGCCGVLLIIVQRAVGLAVTEDDATARELLGVLGDAYPTWWIVLGGVLCTGQVLGYLVVAALLALPGAHAFYRMPPTPAAPAVHQPPPPAQ